MLSHVAGADSIFTLAAAAAAFSARLDAALR